MSISFESDSNFGFLHYDLFPILDHLSYLENWSALKAAFNDLPKDPYCESSNIRRRRYGYAYFHVYLNEIVWPKSVLEKYAVYDQGDHNPEYEGVRRRFSSISVETLRNPIVRLLIENDFHRTRFFNDRDAIFRVGLHLVRLEVDRRHPVALVSPDCLHRDGEPYTFAHLVRRVGVVGGENCIASVNSVGEKIDELSNSDVLAKFVLENELESFAVDDRRVSHALENVRLAPGANLGLRDVVLIDFTRFRPRLED